MNHLNPKSIKMQQQRLNTLNTYRTDSGMTATTGSMNKQILTDNNAHHPPPVNLKQPPSPPSAIPTTSIEALTSNVDEIAMLDDVIDMESKNDSNSMPSTPQTPTTKNSLDNGFPLDTNLSEEDKERLVIHEG